MQKKMLRRLKIISVILKWIFIIAMVAVPVMYLLFWVTGGTAVTTRLGFSVIPSFPTSVFATMPTPVRLAGFCVSLIPLIFFMFKNYYLARLFHLYQKGVIFKLANVRYIRNIGIVMLLWEIISPFYQVLLTFILSSQNPPGQHFVTFSINSIDISTTIIAVIIIVVSWIMREGVELQQDQQYTV